MQCLVVAISVDSQFTHLGTERIHTKRAIVICFFSLDQHSSWTRWSRKDSNPTPIRFDSSNFQRLRRLPSRCWPCLEVRTILWTFDWKLSSFSFRRGLFIIDGRGILRQITMNDLPVGRSTDETLRLLQAFQYTDKHGEGKKKRCLVRLLIDDVFFPSVSCWLASRCWHNHTKSGRKIEVFQ